MMRSVLLGLLVCFLFAGCRTDLVYPTSENEMLGELMISVDWGDTRYLPDGVVIYLFPESTTSPGLHDTPIISYKHNKGARIKLPYGTYCGFVYNESVDVNNLSFRGMDQYLTSEVYVQRKSINPQTRINVNKYVEEPDPFYKAQIGIFTLSESSSKHSVTVSPKLKSIRLEFNIGVTGLENIKTATANVSGIAKALNLSTGKINTFHEANVYCSFQKNSDNTGIIASINCFGVLYDKDGDNIMDIIFTLRDEEETKIVYEYDITDDITDEIRDDGGDLFFDGTIDIPHVDPEEGEGGGFDVGVGDWGNVDIDLPV